MRLGIIFFEMTYIMYKLIKYADLPDRMWFVFLILCLWYLYKVIEMSMELLERANKGSDLK